MEKQYELSCTAAFSKPARPPVTTIQELMQTMFVAEVLQPGEEVWIVAVD